MILSALPWIVIAMGIVEFALVDDLPAPVVRRTIVAVSFGLVAVTLVATLGVPSPESLPYLLAAAGPLIFLGLHAALRWTFGRLKHGEPVLLYTPEAHRGRTPRYFHQPDASRRVSGWDYPYSLLVGVALLASLAPAMAVLMEHGS